MINNAGFVIPGSIEDAKVEDFDSIMATNIRGTFLITHLAVPFLIQSKGNIINVSSIAGARPIQGVLAYAVSKAALDHFSRCVALELAPKGVRCNTINPGVIDTNFYDAFGLNQESAEYVAALELYAKVHPIGRVGGPG